MKRIHLHAALLCPMVLLVYLFLRQPEAEEEFPEMDENVLEQPADTLKPASEPFTVVDGDFPHGSTLQDVLFGHSFSPEEIHWLIADTRPVYDLNRVRGGNRYRLEFGPYGQTRSFEYEISDEESLVAYFDGQAYQAFRRPVEFETVREHLSASLSGSLWETLTRLGEKQGLIMAMAELLQWDVDFTSVHEGDSFKVIVDKKFKDGALAKYGDVYAVQFRTGGKDFFAFRFVNPDTGKVHYYDHKGNSIRKAFLKVPFRFSPRISSGFSYNRLHPILKKRRPHLGIDFAAPKGTPVLASANGSVVAAGWNGGFGNFVKLKHGNGYQTSYGHLSRIRVRRGSKVSQGQVIGHVGSTGLATGPHLDYRVQDPRGRYLNPRKRVAWPSDKPLDKRYWSAFAAVRDGYSGKLTQGLGYQDPSAALLLTE